MKDEILKELKSLRQEMHRQNELLEFLIKKENLNKKVNLSLLL